MNILIVLAHPRPTSLNASLAGQLAAELGRRHSVVLTDLYRENFDPVLKENELLDINYIADDIRPYCDALIKAGCLIFIHPNWWGAPPAILKGWVDRVIRLNVGYGFNDAGQGEPIKLLNIKHFFVFNTSNTPPARELAVFGDPLENIWKNCIADFLGTAHFERQMFSTVAGSTTEQRDSWIKECCGIVQNALGS